MTPRDKQPTRWPPPNIDWRGVKGIREVIAHDYDEIDIDLLAATVRGDLPGLKAAILGCLGGSGA
jgi:uncharacterized protein with HEPN domain